VTVSPPSYTFDTFGDGFWTITNAQNGQVLTVNAAGSSQESYTNGAPDQQFALLYNYQNSTFRILQHSDWQCIGAASSGAPIGSAVTPINYTAQNSQQWYLGSVGNGRYRIINAASGFALQTDNGNPANVTLAAAAANPAQYWGISYQTHWPKKGTAGYEGPPYQGEFQTAWAYNYNDNTGASEPSNFDFVPMADNEDWEPISDMQSRDPGWLAQPLPAYLLGYNEPDNPSQNTPPTVSEAIANWPALMALDVPLVAPAMQNEQDSWETSFYQQIAANGYRVDYAACHLYVPPNTASFIGDIQSEYNAHGLPVWVTEFSPVDWNGCQCWSEDDDYNFLAEFMWEAEGLNWISHYAVFPFSNTNPNNPWVDNGFTGSVFMSDGQTLSPYGELYATWDGVTALQTNTPYLIHNLGTSFRLTTTNSSSVPVSQDIYVRNASAQWALIPAPAANQYYIISLNDGRRLCNNAGTPGLAAPGTTNSTCQWWMNGPTSLGYYYIDNLSVSQSIEATGSPPAISFGMINDPAPSAATEWRLIKPYQPVAIVTPQPPSLTASYTSKSATLTFSGNGAFYNVYRSTNSGASYTLLASYVVNTNYIDNTVQNGNAYNYVVTTLNFLGAESAWSAPVTAYPASMTSPAIAVNSLYNLSQNAFEVSWPLDHKGWRLLMDTNGLSSPNWIPVPNSAATNQVWIPFSAGQNAFFELVYP
ncbi:MAG TPA: glycosyl hydrolase, partial [Verrucomicrobiae bacterium]|nr:glycosyl hydrolase [Verrucomicrobiae bacterium]